MIYGNICLATSRTSFLSKMIRWFTRSSFSHSFVTMPDVLGVPMCIEASEGGVDMARMDLNYTSNADEALEVWELSAPLDAKNKAVQSVLSDLEITYGILEYPWFIWRRICGLFGKDIRSRDNWNQGGMICSQLCVAYLSACGLSSIFAGYGKGSVAPQDLREIMLAHPELFKLTSSK